MRDRKGLTEVGLFEQVLEVEYRCLPVEYMVISGRGSSATKAWRCGTARCWREGHRD